MCFFFFAPSFPFLPSFILLPILLSIICCMGRLTTGQRQAQKLSLMHENSDYLGRSLPMLLLLLLLLNSGWKKIEHAFADMRLNV